MNKLKRQLLLLIPLRASYGSSIALGSANTNTRVIQCLPLRSSKEGRHTHGVGIEGGCKDSLRS